VEIGPATLAEATSLRGLHLATWEAAYRCRAHEGWYGEQLAAHAARDWREIILSHAKQGGGVLSARCDGGLLGFCEYGPSEDPEEDPREIGQIHRLYVSPARQRAGIGRSLLSASVDLLHEEGARSATLWVLKTDRYARAFYERLGWRPDGASTAGQPTDLRYRRVLR